MKKYATLMRLSWNRVWVYKGVNFVYLSLSLLNILLNLVVWQVAYRTGDIRSGIYFGTFVSYFLLVLVVHQLSNSFSAGVIAEEHIKKGELSNFLLKPFPYFMLMLILEIPWRVLSFLLSLPVFGVLIYVYRDVLSISSRHLPFMLLTIVLAYGLSFLIQISLAQLTFWLEDIHGIFTVWEVLWLLFAGSGIPLFFLPPWLYAINSWLPFQYIIYFPVRIGLGLLNPTEIIIELFRMILWMIFFFFIAKLLWKNGLQKFTGEGI